MNTVMDVLREIDKLRMAKDTPSKWTLSELDDIILRLNSSDYAGIDRKTLDRVEAHAKWLRGIYVAKADKDTRVPLWNVLIRLGSNRGPMVEKQERFL